jgi:predicted ribosomally synthesized peptide with SipW-like signal peptide
MKNVWLSIIVVATLVAAGVGGTFAGFVDTEVSQDNTVQAGISDLLINGKNDPIGAKLVYVHAAPEKSVDFWVDAYNWGECQGGWLYIHFKDVESIEDGAKLHLGQRYVYDGVSEVGGGIPNGYRVRVGTEPIGPGVWSSEPEKISENGSGYIAQYWVAPNNPNLLGEDYASGISDHLDVNVMVPKVGATSDVLGNPDDNGDGTVTAVEAANWTAKGNRWEAILTGKLSDIECNKTYAGFLATQTKTFFHIDVVIQQIYDSAWGTITWTAGVPSWTGAGIDYDGDTNVDLDDFQKAGWPTNALQGDKAEWDMLFELITDP